MSNSKAPPWAVGGLLLVKTQSQALRSSPVREANPEFPLLTPCSGLSTEHRQQECWKENRETWTWF